LISTALSGLSSELARRIARIWLSGSLGGSNKPPLYVIQGAPFGTAESFIQKRAEVVTALQQLDLAGEVIRWFDRGDRVS